MTYVIRQKIPFTLDHHFWTGSAWRQGRSYAREYATEKEAQRELNSHSGELSFRHATVVSLSTIKKVKVI